MVARYGQGNYGQGKYSAANVTDLSAYGSLVPTSVADLDKDANLKAYGSITQTAYARLLKDLYVDVAGYTIPITGFAKASPYKNSKGNDPALVLGSVANGYIEKNLKGNAVTVPFTAFADISIANSSSAYGSITLDAYANLTVWHNENISAYGSIALDAYARATEIYAAKAYGALDIVGEDTDPYVGPFWFPITILGNWTKTNQVSEFAD